MAEYLLPSLGADMESATLVEWHVAPGDAVRKGEIVGVVETEKSVMDIEFFQDGVIEEVLVPVGEKVMVGTPLLRFRPTVTLATPAPPAVPAVVVPAPPVAEATPVTAPPRAGPTWLGLDVGHRIHPPVEHLARELGVDLSRVIGTGPRGRVTKRDVRAAAQAATPAAPTTVRRAVSPRARRLAEQRGIDLSTVPGTGPDGSVTFEDVERAPTPAAAASMHEAREAPEAPAATPGPPAPAATAAPEVDRTAERQQAMRHAIAVLMARSKREIPHYYLALDIDLSRPMAWLTEENVRRPMTERLLPAALLVKATALALRDVPEMNGFWQDDHFEPGPGIHPGIAISLRGGGLVAPAIHDADRKTLSELMAVLRDLVARTRTGSLHRAEMADPTITITNLGDQGVDAVHGVIYPPQVALVGFGRIRDRPVAIDGLVGARPVLTATLAADHRNSDGHRGGLFLAAIDRHLQEPEKL